MKAGKKVCIAIALIAVLAAVFFAGRYVERAKNAKTAAMRCRTMLGFAIDKAENGDLAEEGTRRALISNVYAAYQFCGDTIVADQLHDVWNYLIFEGDADWENAKQIALIELKDALRAIKAES